jgi:hypothetical protein
MVPAWNTDSILELKAFFIFPGGGSTVMYGISWPFQEKTAVKPLIFLDTRHARK